MPDHVRHALCRALTGSTPTCSCALCLFVCAAWGKAEAFALSLFVESVQSSGSRGVEV